MLFYPFTPQCQLKKTCSVVLTFQSVDEILWCDHLDETPSAVLLHGAIWFQYFTK